LLLPLYTKFLTPEDYGYLAIFSVFQSVIEITAVFGLSSGLFRYYIMANDAVEQQEVINTCFWTMTLFIVGLTLIMFLFMDQFSLILFGSTKYSKYLTMVTVTGLLSAFGNFIFSFMRAERKPIFFAVAQTVKVLLLTLANVYFVAVLLWSYAGIIIGNLVVGVAITFIVLIWFSRFISFSFSSAYFKKIIIFVTPIYMVNVFFLLLNLSDRFFLNYFLSPTEVGLYSFGNKMGSVVMIGVITPFSIAVVPYALSIAKEKDFKKIFSKIMKYFLIFLISLSLCIFYFSKEIILVMSNVSYVDASGIIGPVLLSSIFYGLYYNLSIAIDIVEKTYLSTIVVVTGAVVSIGLNYYTIPLFGMYGSALASCISNGVLFLLMYFFCQRHFPIHYEVAAFLKLMGIIILYTIIYSCIVLAGLPAGIAIPIKIILCILFPGSLFVARIFDAKEREYANNYIQRVMHFTKQS
jgi:O-antigen/teichoic acid export membrane protein